MAADEAHIPAGACEGRWTAQRHNITSALSWRGKQNTSRYLIELYGVNEIKHIITYIYIMDLFLELNYYILSVQRHGCWPKAPRIPDGKGNCLTCPRE